MKTIFEIQDSNIHSVKENDAIFRMNYLYQASCLQGNQFYAAYLMKQCKEVGNKKVIRMTSQMKKTHCKLCQYPLQMDLCIEKKGNKVFVNRKCSNCSHNNRSFVKKLNDQT